MIAGPPPGRYRALRRSILWASGGVALGVLLLAVLAGWRDLRTVEEELARDQRNLLLVTAEHARWTFWAADTVLNQIEQVVQRLGHAPTLEDAQALYPQLQRMTESLGGSHRWFLVDGRGQLLTSALRQQARGVDVSDRDYFRFHEMQSSPRLHIGAPLQTRPSSIWSFTVSRGLYDERGRLVAVAGLAIGLPYFLDFYSRLDLGDDATAVLARSDGQLLIRQPFDPANFDKPLATLSPWLAELQGRMAQRQGISPYDGRQRLVSVQQLAGYPVAALITVSVDRVTEAWQARMRWLGFGVLLLLGTLAAFARWMWRQVDLVESNAEAALQDGLTGLANRRAFDEQLQRELARGQRERRAVALLMLDVDHFKRYNDALGHGAGDEALRLVANCLRQGLRRPTDLAARWGGEEFAVLLPGCTPGAAEERAEFLRAAVAAAALPHPGLGPGHKLTVSVGAALWMPGTPLSASQLLADADAALYEAKRDGRDRVVLKTHAA